MYCKHIIVILSCVAVCVLGRPSDIPPEKQQPTVIPIVSQSEEVEPNGTYKFSYETGNGIKREEIAYEKVLPKSRDASSNEGGEDDDDSNEIHVQKGSYSYTAPDGTVITVRYIADENGFQPIGDHIHRSPVVLSSSNSDEKSGRSLKTPDSSEAASAVVKAQIAEKPAEIQSRAGLDSIPAANEEKTPSTVRSATEASEATTANVDVSTEAASTAAPAQPSTEPEQASTASAEPASTSEPEQSASTEDSESLSSTSAPEQSSSSEALGQSTTSESLSQTAADETEQPSTNASQSASGEESSSTTVSA